MTSQGEGGAGLELSGDPTIQNLTHLTPSSSQDILNQLFLWYSAGTHGPSLLLGPGSHGTQCFRSCSREIQAEAILASNPIEPLISAVCIPPKQEAHHLSLLALILLPRIPEGGELPQSTAQLSLPRVRS